MRYTHQITRILLLQGEPIFDLTLDAYDNRGVVLASVAEGVSLRLSHFQRVTSHSEGQYVGITFMDNGLLLLS